MGCVEAQVVCLRPGVGLGSVLEDWKNARAPESIMQAASRAKSDRSWQETLSMDVNLAAGVIHLTNKVSNVFRDGQATVRSTGYSTPYGCAVQSTPCK